MTNAITVTRSSIESKLNKPTRQRFDSLVYTKVDKSMSLEICMYSHYQRPVTWKSQTFCFITSMHTRRPAVARLADHTGCHLTPFSHNSMYWHSRSSKVDDFHLIWPGICYFLLVSVVN